MDAARVQKQLVALPNNCTAASHSSQQAKLGGRGRLTDLRGTWVKYADPLGGVHGKSIVSVDGELLTLTKFAVVRGTVRACTC